MNIYKELTPPPGLGNFGDNTPGGTYDLVLFNNATKQGYVYKNLYDAGTPMCVQINEFDIGDVPTGEYTYVLIRNDYGYVDYTLKNTPLDSVLLAGGQEYRLTDLNPEIGLFKYVGEDSENEPQYRDTDKEFYYRRK